MGTTTSDETNIAGLVKQLQGIKAFDIKDEESRKTLFEAARNAAFTLESPGDSIQRITYIVRPWSTACPVSFLKLTNTSF